MAATLQDAVLIALRERRKNLIRRLSLGEPDTFTAYREITARIDESKETEEIVRVALRSYFETDDDDEDDDDFEED